MADFRGKVVVVFFGFTQCPDVCPTSMTTMAEVKRLMGDQGNKLQVLFITVDPERDTLPLLKAVSYTHLRRQWVVAAMRLRPKTPKACITNPPWLSLWQVRKTR